jgi:hypothetical protein
MDNDPAFPDAEAIKALLALFSEGPAPARPALRRYILELEEGEPVFRRDGDEIELAINDAIREVCGPAPEDDGDEIVPQKLAKSFPGPNRDT